MLDEAPQPKKVSQVAALGGQEPTVACYHLQLLLLGTGCCSSHLMKELGTMVVENLRNILTQFGPSTANAVASPSGQIWD